MAVAGNCDHCLPSDTYYHCCLVLDEVEEGLQIGWGGRIVCVRREGEMVERR